MCGGAGLASGRERNWGGQRRALRPRGFSMVGGAGAGEEGWEREHGLGGCGEVWSRGGAVLP